MLRNVCRVLLGAVVLHVCRVLLGAVVMRVCRVLLGAVVLQPVMDTLHGLLSARQESNTGTLKIPTQPVNPARPAFEG